MARMLVFELTCAEVNEELVRVCVRVVLVDVLAERFLALKEKRGIVNNTELVRLLITNALKTEGLWT